MMIDVHRTTRLDVRYINVLSSLYCTYDVLCITMTYNNIIILLRRGLFVFILIGEEEDGTERNQRS